ncbi:NAD(P)H-dependent oxidoreductase [Staphylococcus caprae]
MISLVYSGNQKGVCFEIYSKLRDKLNHKELKIFNLQYMSGDIPILYNGYYSEMKYNQNRNIEILEKSSTLIFIYPIYWFNVPMLLKGFIDSTFWPNKAFSFKNKRYFKNGLWKDKNAIVIYTIGGPELFHKIKGHLGYKVMKYPLNLVGIFNIKRFYIDNINKSGTYAINNRIEVIVDKVMEHVR